MHITEPYLFLTLFLSVCKKICSHFHLMRIGSRKNIQQKRKDMERKLVSFMNLWYTLFRM